MRNSIISFFVLLAFATTAGAQERLLTSSSIHFPDPIPQYQRQDQVVAGPWRLWVDAKVLNPQHHVPTWVSRIYRVHGREQPEFVAEFTISGNQLHPLLSYSGQVLIDSKAQLMLYPVDSAPVELVSLRDRYSIEKIVYFNDEFLLAVRKKHDTGKTMEVLRVDLQVGAVPVVLQSTKLRREPDNFVYGGTWVAWVQQNDEDIVHTVRVTPLGKRAHDVQLVDAEHPILDGIYGNWLLAHEGDLVYLLNLETNRELLLRLPGEVQMVHPRGILWQVDRYGSIEEPTRMVWWDLVTQFRHNMIVQNRGNVKGVAYQLALETLVRSNNNDVSEFHLNAQPKPLDAGVMASAENRLELLRQVWTQQPDFVMRVLRDFHWPFGVEAPELLAEIVVCDDRNTARRAMFLLGLSGDPKVRAILLRLLSQVENRTVWGDVVKAITRIGKPEDAALILAYNTDTRLNVNVVEALGILCDPDSKPWLEDKLLRLHLDTTGAKEAVNRALRLLADRNEALDVFARLRELETN